VALPSIIDGVAFHASCRCLHKSNLAVVRDRRAGIIGEERRVTWRCSKRRDLFGIDYRRFLKNCQQPKYR